MNEKGYSTIELMLAIVIAGMIMAAVGSFLNFSIRSFNLTKEVIDVQYEAQMASNQLTDILKPSSGIVTILDQSGTDSFLISNQIDVSSFEVLQEVSGASDIIYTITFDTGSDADASNDNQIMVSIDGNPAYTMATNIESFKLKPSNDNSFEGANGVEITFIVKDNESEHDVTTQVKFRNKE